MPAFVTDWNHVSRKVRICFQAPDRHEDEIPGTLEEKRYAFRMVRQRIHQGQFRESVLSAYGNRCALSRISERRLLDAAHIIPDSELGQPVISNGLLLSKIHHAAFDGNLIGIDPDYGIHVSKHLLDQKDGPTLEALKGLAGKKLRLPKRTQDHPDRNCLAVRYEKFKAME